MTLLPGDVIACGTSVGVGSIKDGSTRRGRASTASAYCATRSAEPPLASFASRASADGQYRAFLPTLRGCSAKNPKCEDSCHAGPRQLRSGHRAPPVPRRRGRIPAEFQPWHARGSQRASGNHSQSRAAIDRQGASARPRSVCDNAATGSARATPKGDINQILITRRATQGAHPSIVRLTMAGPGDLWSGRVGISLAEKSNDYFIHRFHRFSQIEILCLSCLPPASQAGNEKSTTGPRGAPEHLYLRKSV